MTFQGISYGFEMYTNQRNRRTSTIVKAIYEQGKHDQLLFEMGRVLRVQEYGCSLVGVEIEELLQHIGMILLGLRMVGQST